MASKFWNWAKDDNSEARTLFLEGVIAEESWFEDDVTPAMFKAELMNGSGPIMLHINSPGGDVIAASQIYTMLMDYPHEVKVQIDGIAASAASVIAMAGTKVSMSPTSLMMIHNPLTFALGDSEEMRRAIQLLDEVKESIINAYEIKTGLSRVKLAHMMDAETWMNAHKARELGFCDEVLYQPAKMDLVENSFTFSRCAVTNSLLDKLKVCIHKEPSSHTHNLQLKTPIEILPEAPPDPPPDDGPPTEPCNRVNASGLEKRLARFQFV